MKRTATAVWNGPGKTGNGYLSTQSGILNKTQYSFNSRFESGTGTNPEELIASAHAGCFTMAFSFMLGGAGFEPEKITTNAELTMDFKDNTWTVTNINLNVLAKVPGIDQKTFIETAENAKKNCPISRLLSTNITMSVNLEG